MIVLFALISMANAQTPINSDFTYQGELVFNNQLANGAYDFEINAYDALTDGNIYDAPYSVDAISVVNGIFQIPLDYGNETFMGDEVYLEISVRENGSGQPYELLSPRQKINNAPYAIHAQYVGADAVTNTEILDGSIGEQDLANNSVTSDKIASNAVGNSEIISTQVQRRVSGSCTVGSYIRSVNEDGSVVCETDSTGNSNITSEDIVDGTIANVDLADNSIGSNEIINQSITSNDIASDSITASMITVNAVGSNEIAPSAVGESEINSAEVQSRVSQTCDEGFYLRGINEDGSVQCQQLPFGSKHDLFSIGSSRYISIAIMPSNGFPIISYTNSSGRLSVYECTNLLCTSGVVRNLESYFGAGYSSKITILPSGLPIISYDDITNDDLKVYRCLTFNCSSGSPVALDEMGDVGSFPSITTGNTGLPIMSYIDNDNNSLKVRACFNSMCTTGNDWVLDSNSVKFESSIVIRPSTGLPLISYFGDNKLKLYNCTNSFCSSGNSIVLDSSVNEVGRYANIVFDSSNIPLISYHDETNGDLKLYRCNDENCSTGSSRILESNGNVGNFSSIAFNPADSTAIISFVDITNSSLKLYKCSNSDCTIGSTHVLDSSSYLKQGTSIVINNENKPQVAYKSNDKLAIYSCFDAECDR